ncbi:MAG: outer membrane lipid asymmetry maintenance protein MlaD [Pseudomonadales bacterium]|nr:outer membrane lipid asymmetry maintenance protein MlaD [Pseudomonadales bacterium]
MSIRTTEIIVGAFVLACGLALAFLAVRVSGVDLEGNRDAIMLSARFDEVGGLSSRAKVSMAGVTIGRVIDIDIDTEFGEAIVTMAIDGRLSKLSLDTGARILTEGVLGGKYVGLIPGADEEYLVSGDVIVDTQGAILLENLIGEFVTGAGSK